MINYKNLNKCKQYHTVSTNHYSAIQRITDFVEFKICAGPTAVNLLTVPTYLSAQTDKL